MVSNLSHFLVFLAFVGTRLLQTWQGLRDGHLTVISAIYLAGILLYAVIVLMYIVGVVQLLRRVNWLKKKIL